MEKFIKDFARSLTNINFSQYDKCYLIEAEAIFYAGKNKKTSKTEVSISKDTHRMSVINSRKYSQNNELTAEMKIVLLKKELNLFHSSINKNEVHKEKQYWRSFSRKEILDFSKETNDKNSIHLTEKPIVQGLMIFMHLCSEDIIHADIKFLNKIFCDEKIYLSKEDNLIIGYVNDIICFKCIIKSSK